MPDVGEQLGAQAAASMQAPDVAVDSSGRTFDPALHSVGADGKPRLTKAGRLRVRRGLGGRAQEGEPEDASGLTPEVQMAGVAAANTFILVTAMFGLDNPPPTKQEREALQVASADTLAYYGVERIHPLVSLSAVILVYLQPRLAQPEIRGRLARWWYRMRHRGQEVPPDAYSDSRHNGMWENDAGNPDVEGLRPHGPADPYPRPVA